LPENYSQQHNKGINPIVHHIIELISQTYEKRTNLRAMHRGSRGMARSEGAFFYAWRANSQTYEANSRALGGAEPWRANSQTYEANSRAPGGRRALAGKQPKIVQRTKASQRAPWFKGHGAEGRHYLPCLAIHFII